MSGFPPPACTESADDPNNLQNNKGVPATIGSGIASLPILIL
jgi:hypothetical protein